VASSDYSHDVLIGSDLIGKVAESVRKLRNVFRFILGNLSDFKDHLPFIQFTLLDKYMVQRILEFAKQISSSYDSFNFTKVYQLIVNFVNNDTSSFYFELAKDRLYCEHPESRLRKSAQTTLFLIYDVLVKAVAPILCHLAEEVHDAAPFKSSESVFQNGWISLDERWRSPEVDDKVQLALRLRTHVNLLLEIARTRKLIGRSLDADVEIRLPSSSQESRPENPVLRLLGEASREKHDGEEGLQLFSLGELEELLIVSNVSVDFLNEKQTNIQDNIDNDQIVKQSIELLSSEEDLTSGVKMQIRVQKSTGVKCLRCWKFFHKSSHQELCERCHQTVIKLAL